MVRDNFDIGVLVLQMLQNPEVKYTSSDEVSLIIIPYYYMLRSMTFVVA